MRPSAPRDDARRSPGMKPSIERRSEVRGGRCAEVGKDEAVAEATESRERVTWGLSAIGEGESGGTHRMWGACCRSR